jgi:hypothetical protein
MCTHLAAWTKLNLECQYLPDRRAASARREGLNMNEDILTACRWFDEPETSLIIPRSKAPVKSHR